MDDITIALTVLLITGIAVIFTAIFSSSDLFSNRWVNNRSAARYFSLAWIKAGDASKNVAKGAAACILIFSTIVTIGHEYFLFPVFSLAGGIFFVIAMNIWIEVRGGRMSEHYWKTQLRRPLGMYFDPPKKVEKVGKIESTIGDRWKLACMRAGLQDIANIDGRVSTPPILQHSENEIIVDPLGFDDKAFEKCADKLSATLGKKIHAVKLMQPGRMRISLEIRPLPEILNLEDVKLGPDGIMFGESVTGPIIVHPNKWPHLMIAGTSGSGKSIFLRFMCYQFIKYFPRAIIAIIDVKREDFEVFERWPNFVRARNAEHLTTIAKALEQERNRRENTRMRDWEDVFLIIDEANEVICKQNTRNIERLLTMSRSADMHIGLCQQRSTISDTSVTGVMRANASMRICFRVDNAPDSRVMLNTPAGIKIPMIPGRAIILDRNTGKNVTVQSPMVRTSDVDKLIDQMLPRCRPQKLSAQLRELIQQSDKEN